MLAQSRTLPFVAGRRAPYHSTPSGVDGKHRIVLETSDERLERLCHCHDPKIPFLVDMNDRRFPARPARAVIQAEPSLPPPSSPRWRLIVLDGGGIAMGGSEGRFASAAPSR